MNVNLAYYSFADNKFYEPLDVLNADITIFKAVSSACSNEYEIYESGIYLCATSKLKMPKQGWKIHISASYDNAIHILNIVAKELVPQKCSFKVIKSLDLYLLTSQKPFSRTQFGKFITVYPESNSRFIALLEILNKKLSNFEGPEILTDRQYKQCKVLHYRYGGFEPIEKVTPYGQTLYLIQNGFGALTEDVRSPYYSLPIGIEEIILNEPILEIPRLFREYSVEKAIRFTNSGGVYEAKQKSTQRRVIIKEARPFTQMTKASVNSIKLRKKEAEILQNCKNSSFFPELIDSFDDSGHYFIVEEYIEGETLFHYVLHNNPFLKMKGSEPARRYIKTIVTFVADLFSAIVYLSSKGYEMHDLTPDNVMITDGGQIKIVDMEGCLRTGESEAFIGKNSFVMNGDRRFAALKELGLLLLSCIVTGKDALLALNRDAISQQLEHIDHLYSLCDEIKELILELTFARESSFIAVRRIIDNLQRKPLEKLVTRLNGEFQPNTHDDIARVLSGIIGTHGKTKKSTFPITPLFGNSMNYNVGFRFEQKEVLQIKSMNFRQGGKYALVGESGCGKTTLAKILMGLLENYTGTILYGDKPLNRISRDSLYQAVAYVDQKVYLFQDTLRFNITLGATYSEERIDEIVRNCNLKSFVDSLPNGLDTQIAEDGKNMSGGQRQRIALARALIRNVALIILDEGTAALDESNALEIEMGLMRDPNIGVIIITHTLRNEVKEYLDAVYELKLIK